MSTDLHTLIDKHVYDASILPQLMEQVDADAKEGTYDHKASCHLLKLYKFSPELSDTANIGKVLLSALADKSNETQNVHFLSCSYLVPLKVRQQEPLASIFALSALLESANFTEFWVQAQSSSAAPAIAEVCCFAARVQAHIAALITSTYSTISVGLLAQFLGVQASEVAAIAEKKGWTVQGEQVTLPASKENNASSSNKAQPKVNAIPLDDVARFL